MEEDGKQGAHGRKAKLPNPPVRIKDRQEARNIGAMRRRADGRLDPSVDFERYREAACKRFISRARRSGQHAFHDLDKLAEDFYSDFWADWIGRDGDKQLPGPVVPYIAEAMMNKLRDLSRRGRSVRTPQLVRVDGEKILATVGAEDPEPPEQIVSEEEMWLLAEIVHNLPYRERVAFLAVFNRDSKKKGAPLAGYKLAALLLGVSEIRAKKLALSANRLIRAAVEQIELGTWCERWAESIRLVAAGGEGETEFRLHAEHCAKCYASVVDLRHQATLRSCGRSS
jgi:DNA-directed RNA polymerase specialized sigma24 family protein